MTFEGEKKKTIALNMFLVLVSMILFLNMKQEINCMQNTSGI